MGPHQMSPRAGRGGRGEGQRGGGGALHSTQFKKACQQGMQPIHTFLKASQGCYETETRRTPDEQPNEERQEEQGKGNERLTDGRPSIPEFISASVGTIQEGITHDTTKMRRNIVSWRTLNVQYGRE